MRQAFVRQLLEAAKEDPNIILITGDLDWHHSKRKCSFIALAISLL